MPSSGARSGTKPSRNDRGAGDGRLEGRRSLACGHGCPSGQLPIMVGNGKTFYVCPDGCGVVRAK